MRKTPITDQQAQMLYREYLKSLSKENAKLLDILREYDALFDDMCLDAGSAVHDFVAYEIESDAGRFIETADDHYLDLDSQGWRFYVKTLRDPDTLGITFENERKVEISRAHKTDLPVILHEMIHAHEAILRQLFPFYHDILLLCLYRDLEKSIPDLYERVINHTHELFGLEITRSGGSHDALFFLKSLDLDLKLGYPLGTVCGYGRSEYGDESSCRN